ncbi:hypothetical protein GCM10010431_32610 [Streptomyces kunmingensis]
MAGMTTLTRGAMARCVEMARYWAGMRAGGAPSGIAGRTTELLMSLVPLVRWTARPRAVRLDIRFERGVLTCGHDGTISVQAG